MSGIPSSDQRQAAFRAACKRAVEQRDDKGTIPARTSIPTTYSALTDTEKALARGWVDAQVRAAVCRCDINSSSAWVHVMDRMRRYDSLSKARQN